MKQIVCMVLSVVSFLAKAQYDTDKGVKWTEGLNWEQVKSKAKDEAKYIFVDAYATWCGPCKKMDASVYPNERVGEVLNSKFVSVKVQMDETSSDNEQIRLWYNDARRLKEQYKPDGFPCFLFFSSDGRLVSKSFGLQSPDEFINTVKEALSRPMDKYSISLANYKNGIIEYETLPELARKAKGNKEDKVLVEQIAKTYKEQYLDRLSDDKVFTKEHLLFLAEFPGEIKTGERYFRFFLEHGNQADSIMNHVYMGKIDRISNRIVLGIILKEEVKEKLYHNGIPLNRRPRWGRIRHSIEEKFGVIFVEKLFPDEQINFYKTIGDWKNYVKYINKKIAAIPPKAKGHLFGGQLGDAWMLNYYTWRLFEKCEEKEILKKGIPWIDMAIKLESSTVVSQFYDTKANLLYKLGNVEEAISLEKKAVAILLPESSLAKKYMGVIDSMRTGKPTWINKVGK